MQPDEFFAKEGTDETATMMTDKESLAAARLDTARVC